MASVLQLQIEVNDKGTPVVKALTKNLDDLGKAAAGSSTGMVKLDDVAKRGTISAREMSLGVGAISSAFGAANPQMSQGLIHASRFISAVAEGSTSARLLAGGVVAIGAGIAATMANFQRSEEIALRFATIDRAVNALDLGGLRSELQKTTIELDANARQWDTWGGSAIQVVKRMGTMLLGLPTDVDVSLQAIDKLREGITKVLPFYMQMEEYTYSGKMASLGAQNLSAYSANLLATGQFPTGGAAALGDVLREKILQGAEAAKGTAFSQRQIEFAQAGARGTLDLESGAIVQRYTDLVNEIDAQTALQLEQLTGTIRGVSAQARADRIARFQNILKDQGRLADEYSILGPTGAGTSSGFDEVYRLQKFTEDQQRAALIQSVRAGYRFPDETAIANQIIPVASAAEVAVARGTQYPAMDELRVQLQQIGDQASLVGRKNFDELSARIQATTATMMAMDKQFGASDSRVQDLKASLADLYHAADQRDALRGLFQGINSGITDSLRGVIFGTQTIGQAWANMTQNIALSITNDLVDGALKALERELEKVLLFDQAASSSSGSGIFGMLAGMLGKAIAGWLSPSYDYGPGLGYSQLSANPELAYAGAKGLGGIFPGTFAPLRRFAWGGISDGPMLGMIGEGRYPREAVIPMPDGRTVPVSFTGPVPAAAEPGKVTVILNNQSGLPLNIRQSSVRRSQKEQVVEIFIDAMMNNPDARAAVAAVR